MFWKFFMGCAQDISQRDSRRFRPHTHAARGSEYNFTVPRQSSGAISRTFFRNAIQEWNSLPNSFKSLTSEVKFRRELKIFLADQVWLSLLSLITWSHVNLYSFMVLHFTLLLIFSSIAFKNAFFIIQNCYLIDMVPNVNKSLDFLG